MRCKEGLNLRLRVVSGLGLGLLSFDLLGGLASCGELAAGEIRKAGFIFTPSRFFKGFFGLRLGALG